MSNPVIETEWGHERTDTGLLNATKKLSKPLWVIAVCAVVSTVVTVLVLGYAALSYIQFANALSEATTEETSQIEEVPGEGVPGDEPTE
jgi:uncharacterized membrane protein